MGTNPFLTGSLTNISATNPFLNSLPLDSSLPVPAQELLAQSQNLIQISNQQQPQSQQQLQQSQQADKRKSSPAQVMSINEILESIPKPEHFPASRHRWNTNEEIAGFLLALDRHDTWLSHDVKNR